MSIERDEIVNALTTVVLIDRFVRLLNKHGFTSSSESDLRSEARRPWKIPSDEVHAVPQTKRLFLLIERNDSGTVGLIHQASNDNDGDRGDDGHDWNANTQCQIKR
jgi:hypothetical protein